jgi:flavorubredoxin
MMEKIREIVAPALTVKVIPNKNEIQKCFEFGKEIAKKVAKTNY